MKNLLNVFLSGWTLSVYTQFGVSAYLHISNFRLKHVYYINKFKIEHTKEFQYLMQW